MSSSTTSVHLRTTALLADADAKLLRPSLSDFEALVHTRRGCNGVCAVLWALASALRPFGTRAFRAVRIVLWGHLDALRPRTCEREGAAIDWKTCVLLFPVFELPAQNELD